MLLEVKKQSGVSRSAFTLVEIIVVMGIVAMLAVLSVGGYLQYRKSTILNLSADSMVSQIYSQRDKAVLGAYKSQRADEIRTELDKVSGVATGLSKNVSIPKCFTVLFEKGTDGKFLAYTSQKNFSGKKIWLGNSWVYEECKDPINGTLPEKTAFDLDSLIKIDKVSVGNFSGNGKGNDVLSSLEVRFLPPDGKIEVLVDGQVQNPDLTYSTSANSAPVFGMKVDISYGDNNPDYQKSVLFDFISGVSAVSK